MDADEFAHLLEVFRLAVGSEAHDFVFVAVMREADELGDGGIKNPERVREVDPLIDLDPAATAPPQRGAGKIAKAIDREAGGFLETGEEDGGGEMRQVMLDVMDLRGKLDAIRFFQGFAGGGGAAHVLHLLPHEARIGQMGEDEGEPAPVVRAGFAVERDVVDLRQAWRRLRRGNNRSPGWAARPSA